RTLRGAAPRRARAPAARGLWFANRAVGTSRFPRKPRRLRHRTDELRSDMADPLSQLLDTVRNVPTDRLADALRSLHLRQSDTPWQSASRATARPAEAYDDARRFFVEIER